MTKKPSPKTPAVPAKPAGTAKPDGKKQAAVSKETTTASRATARSKIHYEKKSVEDYKRGYRTGAVHCALLAAAFALAHVYYGDTVFYEKMMMILMMAAQMILGTRRNAVVAYVQNGVFMVFSVYWLVA